jgi:hypothetical protein
MTPGLLDTLIPQCKWNRHEGACLEAFQAIGSFDSIFIEAHHGSNMICKVMSLTSRIKTRSFSEEIVISSNEVVKDYESDMAVQIRKLGNTSRKVAEMNDKV